MNINFKRTALSIALAAASLGIAGASNAFAQDSQLRGRDGYDRLDSRRQSLEERKGYKDGLIAGQRDAQGHLKFHPAGSIRYQMGGVDYRLGFKDGYADAYREYADNNNYRDNDAYRARNDNRNYFNNAYDGRGDNRNFQSRPDGYYDRAGNFHRY